VELLNRRIAVAIVSTLATGCTSFFLRGATPHAGAPAAHIARFAIPACTATGTNASVPGAVGQTYYLVEEKRGLVLYELDLGSSGAAIHNGWADANAIYFFTWVRGSHGWLFTFPRDRKQLPTRAVYAAGTYSTQEDAEDVMHPAGQPSAICTLVPR
jgi:hypothetical protein